MSSNTPEQRARANIDRLLCQAGWTVQDMGALNVHADRGVAVREFLLLPGHGTADYLLYVNGRAAGVVEAKPEGHTLTGVESQSGKYGAGLPVNLPAYIRPLPFLYESTGVETRFTTDWTLSLGAGTSSLSIPQQRWLNGWTRPRCPGTRANGR